MLRNVFNHNAVCEISTGRQSIIVAAKEADGEKL